MLISLVGGTTGLLFKLGHPVSIVLVFPALILTAGVMIGIFLVLETLRELIEELRKMEREVVLALVFAMVVTPLFLYMIYRMVKVAKA